MPNSSATSAVSYPQTKFFQACRGVFEGGGCRGAAHIGAFEAATKCGVNFSEVAGTSAGSIIAALVAAGATPDFLINRCARLKFSELLQEPRKRIKTFGGARVAASFLKNKTELGSRVVRYGAAYSSEGIEDWMDELLSELLPGADRPIKFSDLLLPAWIVATDLTGCRPKVWGTKTTPDAKVAMAVRSSCSIPLFFEPVESGNDFFVDGGLLSNLPSFVFSDLPGESGELGGRILAFRLIENDKPKTEWSLTWIVTRLVQAVISGSTKLQGEIQGNVSTVKIETGDVSSLDLNISKENSEFLLDSGRKAVSTFIKNEHTKLQSSISAEFAFYSIDEMYNNLVREMAMPGRRLIISCVDTEWYWKLFPAVAHWMFAGAEVDVLIEASAYSHREKQRQTFLHEMGVRIVNLDAIPFNGFILGRHDDRHNAAFVKDISNTEHSPVGVTYLGANHRTVIALLCKEVDRHLGSSSRRQPKLELVDCRQTNLIEKRLRAGVHQYGGDHVSIRLAEVILDPNTPRPIELIVRLVRSFKYQQITYLAALYKKFDIPFCAPANIIADGKVVSTITPPIFELWGESLVAIEGNTRVYYSRKIGAELIYAYIVEGVTSPLPGEPLNPREALLSTFSVPSSERIRGFNYENFRSIEGAMRPVAD